MHRGRLSRGGPNSVLRPPNQRGGPLAPPAGSPTKGAPTSTAWIRGPAQQREAPRSSRPSRRWPTQICTGAACPEAATTVSWGRQSKEAASCAAGGRPHERGAHADDVDTRPCPAEVRAAFQPDSPKVADSDLHRGRLSRGSPNSVLGPPNQRGGPLAPPAGARTKGAPTPTAWIRGPAQQRGGPRSSGTPRRWPTQVCTGADCPEAAQTVSWGRLTKEAALSRRRRAPSRKGRPRRQRGYAALPSRGAGRDRAGLPVGGAC